jgi:hypothetical protein
LPKSADRKVRLLIGELRREGFPIMFATSNPPGYYLPESLAELKEGIAQLRSYIIDECLVLRAMKQAGTRYVVGAGQGILL